MSAPLFNIIVNGVREGFDPSQTKTQFARLFKLDELKAERVFNSTPIVLRRNLDEHLANSFVTRLSAIGVSAEKVGNTPVLSKAIYTQDSGETSSYACAMHQPVDFVYSQHQRRIPFLFEGDGFEYFKLCVVNLIVCILSAGILYPWMQMRSLRYFYQHTSLDHKEFQCKDSPQKIYVSQLALIVYVCALGYSFFHSYIYFSVGLILFLCVFPYYLFKLNKYGNFLYRDIGLSQKVHISEAYLNMLVWPLLAVMTAGLLAPFAAFKIQQFRLHKKFLGDCEFVLSTNVKQYLILLPSLLVAEIVVFACIYWSKLLPIYIVAGAIVAAILSVFMHWRVVLTNLQWNNTSTRLGYFVCSWSLPSYCKLFSKNLVLCLLTLGVYWPWAKIHTAHYKATHLAFFANQRFAKWCRKLG